MQTSTEVARVSEHIANAARLAATRDVSQLSHVQQLVRTLLLDELERYRADGRFPQNPDFAERTPYFIDAEGTRCAMAHLMELGGEQQLVEHIATSRNNARVRELADEPQLLTWLEAAGLTVDEAAAIQPSYSCAARSECVCGGSFSNLNYSLPAKGVLEARVQADTLAAKVEHTYGETLGIGVGQTIALENNGQREGDLVLVPLEAASDAGQSPYVGIRLSPDGTYHCTSQGVADAPVLTPTQFATAVTATSCPQTLASQDPDWAKSCDEPLGGGGKNGGCGVAGDASVGILLALVSALVYRRMRAHV